MFKMITNCLLLTVACGKATLNSDQSTPTSLLKSSSKGPGESTIMRFSNEASGNSINIDPPSEGLITTIERIAEAREFVADFELPGGFAPPADAVTENMRLSWKAKAILKYMKNRAPVKFGSLDLPSKNQALDSANNALIGKLTADKITVDFGRDQPIIWNFFDNDRVKSDQFAIQLNRHLVWIDLAIAYDMKLSEGSDESVAASDNYVKAFTSQLRSWLNESPILIGTLVTGFNCQSSSNVKLDWRESRLPRVDGAVVVADRCPLPINAGIRMSDSWWYAYETFKSSSLFHEPLQLSMLAAMRRHGAFLSEARHFSNESNHGMFATNGLFHVALYLQELRSAKAWADIGLFPQ